MRTRTHSSRSSTPKSDAWNGFPPADGRTATLSGLTTLAILGVAFGALALGLPYFWVVFPVGFGGVLPLVLAYSRRTARDESVAGTHAETTTTTTTDSTTDEALRTLRARYARGELTDEAFESRLERLLETETVAEATTWVRRPAVGHEDSDDGEDSVHDGDAGDAHDEGTASE